MEALKQPVRFAQERLTPDLWCEALPLLVAHWTEVAHFKDIVLSPDTDTYMKTQDAGKLRCYTARQAGELVGYACFVVQYHPHYRESLQAAQDVVFLCRHLRGFNGIKFLKYCDKSLQDEGVEVVRQHIKQAHNWQRVLERMGYELEDVIMTRRLSPSAKASPTRVLHGAKSRSE